MVEKIIKFIDINKYFSYVFLLCEISSYFLDSYFPKLADVKTYIYAFLLLCLISKDIITWLFKRENISVSFILAYQMGYLCSYMLLTVGLWFFMIEQPFCILFKQGLFFYLISLISFIILTSEFQKLINVKWYSKISVIYLYICWILASFFIGLTAIFLFTFAGTKIFIFEMFHEISIYVSNLL